MKFEMPTVTDHGSIAENTFWRCESGTNTDGFPPGGKSPDELQHDKFGECSHS